MTKARIPDQAQRLKETGTHEVKIAFARRGERIVHISEVANGYRCGATCIACGAALSARNGGTKQTHHFAHRPGAACAEAYAASLHDAAAQVIAEARELLIPPVRRSQSILGPSGNKLWAHHHTEAKRIRFDRAEREVSLGTFRPDVVGYVRDRSLAIEVFCTHPVDDEKRAKVERAQQAMVELDLSRTPPEVCTDWKRFIEYVVSECGRQWIYNPRWPEIDAGLADDLRRQLDAAQRAADKVHEHRLRQSEAEAERRAAELAAKLAEEEALARERERLNQIIDEQSARIRTLLADKARHRASELKAAHILAEVGARGRALPDYVQQPARHAWIFRDDSPEWQARIFVAFVASSSPGTSFEERDVIARIDELAPPSPIACEVARPVPSPLIDGFYHPQQWETDRRRPVLEYLRFLVEHGFLSRSGPGRWAVLFTSKESMIDARRAQVEAVQNKVATFKAQVQRRVEDLVLMERLLFDRATSVNGFAPGSLVEILRCWSCKLPLLRPARTCPYCDFRRIERAYLTSDDLEFARVRYRTVDNARVLRSVERVPELPAEIREELERACEEPGW